MYKQKRRYALSVAVCVLSLMAILLTSSACSSVLRDTRLDHISPDKVERIVYTPNNIISLSQNVSPKITAKILKIYNSVSKKVSAEDENTPDARLDIYLKSGTHIVVNHIQRNRFLTGVVETGSHAIEEFDSEKLEAVFESLSKAR